jgi:hypothetical protein
LFDFCDISFCQFYEPNKNKLKWRMGLMMSIELQASIIKCIMEKAI